MRSDLVSAEVARGLLEVWRRFDIESTVGRELYVAAGGRFHVAAPALARTVVALSEERDEARRERDRMRDILACERGERAPEGWYWADGQWNREGADFAWAVERNPCPFDDDLSADCPWLPTTWTIRQARWQTESDIKDVMVLTTHPTALEAIEQADKAAGVERG